MAKQNGANPELRDLGEATPVDREEFFNRWASTYDGDLIAKGYQAPWTAADALAVLVSSRDQPILDAGCGTGLVGECLKQKGFSALVGLDESLESLGIARNKQCYERLFCGDLDNRLNFDNDAFIGAICIGTLTYIKDLEALFREFCRVVRSGGYISFTHRTDLYDDAFSGLIRRLTKEHLWAQRSHSDPQPYVPKHDSFADEIGIYYDIYQVC